MHEKNAVKLELFLILEKAETKLVCLDQTFKFLNLWNKVHVLILPTSGTTKYLC